MQQKSDRVRSLLGAMALVAATGCDGSADRGSGVEFGAESQAVVSGPDFVVSSVTGPASAQPGQQLTVTVTVCNQGTQPGGAPVEVYLSADAVIAPNTPSAPSPDFFLGPAYVPTLNPGQCQTVSVQGPASVPTEGAYYFGAVVDPPNAVPEVSETNNIKVGGRIGIGYKPDFIVSSVTGPASAQPGQQVTATVTVCNQGTQPGSAPLEVYLSSDAVITPNTPSAPSPDFFLGYAYVPTLNPGQCQTLSVQGPASVPAEGAYYFGAVVDPPGGLPELIKDNNSKAGSRIGIGYKPDFIVSSVTGPASAQPGQQLTATVTVCNQGTQPGSAPLEVYLSSDAVITPNTPSAPSPDFFLGYAYVPTLNPGQCQVVSVQGPASVPAEGAYYFGAVIDPPGGLPELIKDNNTTTGSRIGIGYKPDFVVSSVTGPASAQPGQQVTATVTVCNQGTQPGSAPLEVYLSTDAVITPNTPSAPSPDFFLGYAYVPTLNPGQCTALTVQGPASVPAEGAYYFGAVVDPPGGLPELIKDNNSKAGSRIGIGYKPDFIVSSVSGPASAQPGQQLTATVTVCNQGTQPGSAPLEVYLSSDSTITPNTPSAPSPDFFLGYAYVPTLNPGQCQVVSVQGPASVPAEGAYYFGAVIDPPGGLPELIKDNNTTTGSRIGIGNKPDFIVSSVTGPASAQPNQQLTATVTVCNQGTQSGSAPLEVYLSGDAVITPNTPSAPSPDFFLGYAYVPTLNPGQCQTVSVQGPASVPSEGAYYFGAVVDPPGGLPELIKDNNTTTGSRIGIGNKPDFVVSSVTGPASALSGQQLTVTVTVCNQGTQPGSAPLEVYLSSDSTITPNTPSAPSPDFFLGYAYVPTLNPGQCQALSVQGPAYVPAPGPYYLGAVVDPPGGLPELIKDNNSKAGSLINMG